MANTTGKKFGGRKRGTPNKITQDAIAELDRLGCNPLELSARIAMGESLDGPHPAHIPLLKIADDICKMLDKGEPVTTVEADRIRDVVEDQLMSGYVPYDLRSKHLSDLLQYVLPKRKAIEVKAEIDDKRPPKIDPSKLSDDALKQLVGARVGEVVEGEIFEDDDD